MKSGCAARLLPCNGCETKCSRGKATPHSCRSPLRNHCVELPEPHGSQVSHHFNRPDIGHKQSRVSFHAHMAHAAASAGGLAHLASIEHHLQMLCSEHTPSKSLHNPLIH